MTVQLGGTRSSIVIVGVMVLVLGTAACSSVDEASVDEAVGSPTTTSAIASPTTATTTPAETPAAEPHGKRAAMRGANLETPPGAVAGATLSADEIDGLLWMREEEKLAHDVYVALYSRWQLPVFDNISQAETTHTDAVKTLLDRYGIDDPAAGNAEGEFTDAAIQELYDDLVTRGSESVVAALEVGALIEEMDILDLQARASDVAEIDRVYENLERGSRNHLRAFVKNLQQRGESYVPSLMSIDQFEDITSAPTERGNGKHASAAGRSDGHGGQGFRGGRSDS